ncbi:MAG: 3-keto-5-aminohexanoate cleavage protein [Dehalococcoidales bacterium]|nr:3-keto-5-aminohexanoate cleavage protein [Dehalococcoidales bacterium]
MSTQSEEKVLRKVIITAAITGAVHTPSMSQYLPASPKQIIDDAVKAYEAGAAAVHIHARTEDGMPTPDLKIFREILTGIKKRCNVVICVTTGGAGDLYQRVAVVPEFKPELATLNCGTLNWGMLRPTRIEERQVEPKTKWEQERAKAAAAPGLEAGAIFMNPFVAIGRYAELQKEANSKPELEIWDIGQIATVKALIEHAYITRPPHIQYVMGMGSGMPATAATLIYALEETRRQIGPEFTWSVAALGRDQLPLGAVALAIGGHVRVGMEDSLYAGYGRFARSSADQVERVVHMAKQLSIAPATPDEARKMLGLKGNDQVNF